MEMTANGNNSMYQQTPYMAQMSQNQQFPGMQQQRPSYPMTPQPMVYPNVCEFVQGEIGATIFQLYPNQKATLIDMDNDEFVYRKSKDATGKISPLVKYKLVPVEDKAKEDIDMSGYAKTDEILDLISEAVENAVQKEVAKRLSEISFKPASKEDK